MKEIVRMMYAVGIVLRITNRQIVRKLDQVTMRTINASIVNGMVKIALDIQAFGINAPLTSNCRKNLKRLFHSTIQKTDERQLVRDIVQNNDVECTINIKRFEIEQFVASA